MEIFSYGKLFTTQPCWDTGQQLSADYVCQLLYVESTGSFISAPETRDMAHVRLSGVDRQVDLTG
jgi:hypothetical protein